MQGKAFSKSWIVLAVVLLVGVTVIVSVTGKSGDTASNAGAGSTAGTVPAVASGSGTSATTEELDWLGLPVLAKEDIDGEIIGEITGKVDGAPFTVYVMTSDVEDWGLLTSASWRFLGGRISILTYSDIARSRATGGAW